MDWATIYYSVTVSKALYLSLLGASLEIEIAGVVCLYEVYEKPSSLVLSAEEGWYVRIQDPDWEQKGPIKQHPIEIQARGRFWAGGRDIWRALEDWERWLGIEDPPDGRIPGRVDLAADVWIRDLPMDCPLFQTDRKISNQPSAYELYRILIGEGDDHKVPEIWATRSRRLDGGGTIDLRVVGRTARTAYIGHKKGIQLVIYNKTAEFAENTKELVRGEWLNRGWIPGNGLVARFEYRVSREAIRETKFPVLDRETGELISLNGNQITFDQVMECLPDLWQTCLTRIRLAPYDGRITLTRQRQEAPLWSRLRRNPPVLKGAGYAEALVAIKRGYQIEELKTRTVRSLINLEHALGPMGPDLAMRRYKMNEPDDVRYKHETHWRGFRKRLKHGKTGSRDHGERIIPREETREEEICRSCCPDISQDSEG